MPRYLRWFREGGTYFFTVNTYQRQRFFSQAAAQQMLRQAIDHVRNERPFEIMAMVLLPDHLHTIWQLPPDDSDFSTRWSIIKRRFTQMWLAEHPPRARVTKAMENKREQGVWQKRFWEHLIEDPKDLANHMDYIHYNPIKHGWARCPHRWAHSSFGRWVDAGAYRPDWLCACHSAKIATRQEFLEHMVCAGE